MAKPKKSKRFLYNLETVLRVRKIRENQEKDKFNEAVKAYEAEKKKEEEIKEYQAEKYSELRDIMTGRMGDVQEIMNRQYHLEVLKGKVKQQEEACIEADRKKEDQRLKLLTAVREKKIMDKDKDKKKVKWKQFMDKEEGKFLDDISTIGYELRRRQAIEDAESRDE